MQSPRPVAMLWLWIMFAVFAPALAAPNATGSATGSATEACNSGWFRYENSCYWFSRWEDRKVFASAKTSCKRMDASLFVSDSEQEFEEVMKHATRAQWTWIGLTGDGIRPDDAEYFKWETESGQNPDALPWLNTAGSAHGHISSSNCVAYYGGLSEQSSYVHWYPCSLLPNRFYICERNSSAIMRNY